MENLPTQLIDRPSFLAKNWKGYYHFQDKTVLPFSVLTFPSYNCSMPSFDKIVPDKGKTLIGQIFDENVGIIGNKQKFKNLGGIEMEARVFKSNDANLKDVIQVGYLNTRLVFNTLVGAFQVGETISGSLSGASGTIDAIVGIVLFLSNISGEFDVGESILGNTSGATANITLAPEFVFHQITENVNPLPRGVHEYYFDEWFDTDLNPANSKNLPRMIWVNGYMDSNIPVQGEVYSWTGGIAVITSIVVNTSISINPATTWRSLGFSEDASGTQAIVVVNGISHVVAVPADLDTSTINIVSTAGMAIGDTATAQIEVDVTPIPFDMCRQNKGYMFYGNWKQRDLYQSNAFNRPSTMAITQAQAQQNDLVLSGIYTGTGSHVYRVTIDKVAPAPTRVAILVGGAFDSLSFRSDDYTLSALNTYRVVIDPGAVTYTTYKNGVVVNALVPIVPDVEVLLVDNIFFTLYDVAPAVYVAGTSWSLTIGGVDSFQWQIDGGVPVATNVNITGGPQVLQDGVTITFVAKRGHSIGDFWEITVNQSIERAWDNFYYTLPIRKPGEGYKYRLPSAFWTMDTQEESLYVNGSYGEWSVIDTILSADLQSETVSLQPLKQSGANKVLFPYLTGHLNDDLVYINTKKELNTIGRKEFLEKPQTGYLSEPVKFDFEGCTFVSGRIKYVNKNLYISSPENGLMLCFDTFNKYWQPPKKFPEVGLLSIIGNDLIAHSNTRNQSFTMFTGATDNGQAYEVSLRTSYTSLGDNWSQKQSNQSFIEGYITGAPKLVHSVYLGIEGCGGIYPHDVEPITCVVPDRAPFGAGSFGSHPFGSDVFAEGAYFQEINKAYAPILKYYFISLGIVCVSKAHTWSVLSLGMNGMYSPLGNNPLTNPSNLAKNNV